MPPILNTAIPQVGYLSHLLQRGELRTKYVDLGAKNKKPRKKKGKSKLNGDPVKTADAKLDDEKENDDLEVEETDLNNIPTEVGKQFNELENVGDSLKSGNAIPSTNGALAASGVSKPSEVAVKNSRETHAAIKDEFQAPNLRETAVPVQIPQMISSTSSNTDTEARLDALARERNALREEVAELRRSLEEIQEKHEEELISLREQLQEAQGEREHVETQYRNLLGKVNTIKSTLGDRLKADAVCSYLHIYLVIRLTWKQEDLSQARTRIEDLEGQCGTLRQQNEARAAELGKMAEEAEQRSKELSSLRNRTTLSQQNWSKEREDLLQREMLAKEEFEAAKQAMQDWEVLAMEERSIRESITERAGDLEEQLSNQREAYEKAASERDAQSFNVDGLQRALHDIQEGQYSLCLLPLGDPNIFPTARKLELRELVENSQGQLESLQKQLHSAEYEALEATNSLQHTRKELERALPFEKEVKEKNLLIGKLRHEAVILNDHLTKALRYLKKRKPEDNIDK